MSALPPQPLQGFSGVPRTPEPGAGVCDATAKQTLRQSGACPSAVPAAASRTYQFRINLPGYLGRLYTTFPPKVRKKITAVIFGASIMGINLAQIAAAASALQEIVVALKQILMLAKMQGAPLDVPRVHAILARIEAFLGGRRHE